MIGQNLFKVDYRSETDGVRTAYVVIPTWEELVEYIHCRGTLIRAECINVVEGKPTAVLIAPRSFQWRTPAVGEQS